VAKNLPFQSAEFFENHLFHLYKQSERMKILSTAIHKKIAIITTVLKLCSESSFFQFNIKMSSLKRE